jgi:CheY-like chemotaxis protein
MKKDKNIVLVVDDNVENIDLLRNLLDDTYTVKAALNGKKALEILQKDQKPDLVLLDVMMPEMDGYAVMKEIKADESTKDIPVIFVTALDETEDQTKGFDLGAADYIAKPIKPTIVQARVSAHINLYNYRTQLREQNEELRKTVRVLENKIGRVKPSTKDEESELSCELKSKTVDDYFLDDDKNDMIDMHEEIDSIIHMMVLRHDIDIDALLKLSSLFTQYSSKLLMYPTFNRLGGRMSSFALVFAEDGLEPSPENKEFSLQCLESLVYTLEHWYKQVFSMTINDVNAYDNSMISDMDTIEAALKNDMDSVESDIEFF